MRFFVTALVAACTATLIWWVAYYLGGQPRPFDGYLLFSLEYVGATLVFNRKGWFS